MWDEPVPSRAMPAAASYSQGYAASVLRSQTWRTAENSAAYLLGHLRPGMNVLDVGCGAGTITVDLAKRVAPGRVVEVDSETHVIRQARELAERREISNVEFVVGDAYDLPRGPTDTSGERFDVVHAHAVLLHLGDPVAALRHMWMLWPLVVWSRRMTRTMRRWPGGRKTVGLTAGWRFTAAWPGTTVASRMPVGGSSRGRTPRVPPR